MFDTNKFKLYILFDTIAVYRSIPMLIGLRAFK